MRALLSLFLSINVFSCTLASNQEAQINKLSTIRDTITSNTFIINGDAQLDKYTPLIKNKSIGMVVNQSSVIEKTHLIDTLISLNYSIKKIFAPEHGIRGTADAGEKINSGKDEKTGIQIISLYGDHKKPTKKDLEGIDILLFDLQDVGVRFYTYISTMHYVMESCAENNIPIIILDRPNPNGDYIAGPVLDTAYQSFVGMHPIPIVHGLTVGELASMINGESWLKNNTKAKLKIIECKNYTHDSIVELKIKPSPNLPNLNSVRWYPSLCLFEPTKISVGRGTYYPFEVFGSPLLDSSKYKYSFTPKSIIGMSKYPKHENKLCYGKNLRQLTNKKAIDYQLLIDTYQKYKNQNINFFNSESFFFKLCGTHKIKTGLENNLTSEEIEKLFSEELDNYKILRKKYLLYPDFK